MFSTEDPDASPIDDSDLSDPDTFGQETVWVEKGD
jgi:hypothetical protein